MAEKKQLGLYWGADSFSIVETSKNKPTHIVHIPFSTPINTAEASVDGSTDVPEDLKYTAQIKKAIADNNITINTVNLSLPAKDLIFRSFIIPWMQSEEVGNVVEFEATKYIPINLEELQYTYHPVTITENKQKNLLIGFVAIRKNILERYKKILSGSGLELNHIEPAPVSLSRVLQQNGHVAKGQSTAIIVIGLNIIKIIILDHEVVQFVREFPVTEDPSNSAAFNAKFFNDVRVSFDFYKRQNPKGSIDKIVIVSLLDLSDLARGLGEETKLPSVFIKTEKLIKGENINDTGLLNAYGAAVRDKKFSTKNLDLSDQSDRANMVGSLFENINIKMLIGILSSCILIIVGTIYLSTQLVIGNRKKLADLRSKQGIFESSKINQIEDLKKDKEKKLKSYNSIRTHSRVSFYLSTIPELLPDGTWLRSLKVQYEENPNLKLEDQDPSKPKMDISLEGYAYLEEANEQFRLVNTLVSRLKDNKGFKGTFSNINLATVNQEKMNMEYLVTFFKINCRTSK